MTPQEIREKFLKFFKERGHKIMPSSSLIPEDKTVLFTTAGMQQFKKYYLNPKGAPSSRIVTIQKCFRTSDIEEVGDKTHLTFFEMMGNFSFGYPKIENSYFKEKAIKWAWEFLTEKEWLGLDKKRISATYFGGDKEKNLPKDEESFKILNKIEGLYKIKPQGFEDNFWSLGTEGSPGGPTVEFYVDSIEIWNLVFNEFIFEGGKYKPSEFRGIDTGMGLERLLSVIQKKESVFETDLFLPILDKIGEANKYNLPKYNLPKELLRRLADHLKASSFLISDGILPGKEDREYILRRLLRWCIRCAVLLKFKDYWYIEPIKETVDIYKDIYPEIKKNEEKIITVFQNEEEKFKKTLENGIKELHKIFSWYEKLVFLERRSVKPGEKVKIEGEDFFQKLEETYKELAKKFFFVYQTYGFPLELSFDEWKCWFNRDLSGAEKEKIIKYFYQEKEKHQEISRKGAEKKFKGGLADESYETTKLHTAAHLLLQALREVLGEHVVQKGSNITSERLRFDFSHSEKLTDEQIKKVEELVNKKIKENLPVSCEEMTVEEAKKQGAMGVFEERYGDKVKVYTIGDFSKEICGGPHVKNTSELGSFKIIKEESVGSGVRRIKAILE